MFCLLLIAAVVARLLFSAELSRPAVQAWTTVFIAICVQAAPFVVLGVAVSTVIAVYVPARFFAAVLPRRQSLAVPLAGVAGCLLPGCECGSVPVAASLSQQGVRAGPALAFLLSAPAVNPVVVVATAVAFPGHPMVVLARFIASMAVAWLVGWIWAGTGSPLPIRGRPRHSHSSVGQSRLGQSVSVASHDLAQTLGLLVIGAASAATLKSTIPADWLSHLAGGTLRSVLALAALAVVLAVCRCLHRGQFDPVLVDRAPRLHGDRPGRRPEADRASGRHVRTGLCAPIRPLVLAHCGGGIARRRLGAAVTEPGLDEHADAPLLAGGRLGMSERTQAFVLLLFGGALVRLGVSDQLLRYVRPVARPWVLLAGSALLALAVLRLVQGHRADRAAGASSGGRAIGTGWLLLAPVVAILVIAPPALGSFSAARAVPVSVSPADSKSFPALTGSAPHQLGLLDFTTRVVWDAGRTLTNQDVALTGFVLSQRPDGFVLARLVITCCAADAQPVEIEVRTQHPPVRGAWVRVVGRYAGVDPELTTFPVLTAGSLTPVAEPTNPYDSG